MQKPIYWLITALALVVMVFILRECGRQEPSLPKEDHRQKLVFEDSLRTAYYIRFRRIEDSILKVNSVQVDRIQTVYRTISRQDTILEIRYKEKPSLALCDTVINSKNQRILTLEERDKLRKQALATQGRIIAAADSLNTHKSGTILQLNQGYAATQRELAKEKGRRFAIVAGLGAGLGPGARVVPHVGVTIGYKIGSF